MKYTYLLFLSSLLLTSCSKDYLFNRDQEKISRELNRIRETDQAVRYTTMLLNNKFNIRNFYTVSDSLFLSENRDAKIDYSKFESENKQINKLSPKKKEAYNTYSKSFTSTRIIIDSINIHKIYDITKKYGYPCFDNRKWKQDNLKVGITYILTHTDNDSEIGKKMLKLMLHEYKRGRVSDGAMKHYLWDIEGRNGKPYDYIIDISKWNKKINGK